MSKIMFEPFHVAHRRIFGNNSFRHMATSDGINRHQHRLIEGNGTVHITNVSEKKTKASKKKSAKEICPHCATKNLIRVDTWTAKCNKCGFER